MPYSVLLLAAIAIEEASAARSFVDDSVVAKLDALVAAHWQSNGINPAQISDDVTFLRRVTLDLVGRIPTHSEALAYANEDQPGKRQRTIRRLMDSPEYALHLGNVLDEIIQGKYAGDRDFISYLRRAIAQQKPWDRVFREVMLGPWDSEDLKPASRFLSRRIRDLDDMTADTSRVFFGIEIACAKCHDHPLVADWTQHHYYGMASFFNRTYEFGKERIVGEKDTDEVTFVDRAGTQFTARSMFLSGKVIDEPKLVVDPKLKDLKERRQKEGRYLEPAFSRREQLVGVALQENKFFSRAIVNHLWNYLFGRGLVHPVDQMHSENPPSIAGVLQLLAEDFSSSGYGLDRLVSAIVSSHAYQLSSNWHSASEPPAAEHFAVAALRPLTPRQYAFSATLAAGDHTLDQTSGNTRANRYRELENRAASLTESMDRRAANFQSSTTEALFMTNNSAVQQLIAPAGSNLSVRLAAIQETSNLVETAFWTVLSRPPNDDEKSNLVQWFEAREQDRSGACSRLVWALLTCAEFRFNH
jgi:hypothetical protein